MKAILIVLTIFGAANAFADSVVGSVTVTIYSDHAGGMSQYQVNDTGSYLVGVGGNSVYLEKHAGGYRGYASARPFNLSCSEAKCTDAGSTQLDVAVTSVSGGYTLSGSLNFVPFDATVTDSKISLSANGFHTNVGFDLGRERNDMFSGYGELNSVDTFTADVSSSGTLEGLKDPAAFITLVASRFIQD